MSVDFEHLLTEYMSTVIACEGLSYVRSVRDSLTDEEYEAILIIERNAKSSVGGRNVGAF